MIAQLFILQNSASERTENVFWAKSNINLISQSLTRGQFEQVCIIHTGTMRPTVLLAGKQRLLDCLAAVKQDKSKECLL